MTSGLEAADVHTPEKSTFEATIEIRLVNQKAIFRQLGGTKGKGTEILPRAILASLRYEQSFLTVTDCRSLECQ